MKGRITDAEIAELIASLPDFSLPPDFNARVLAAAGIGAPEALPARWKLWVQRAAGAAAAGWLGAAAFAVIFLAVTHYDDILPLLLEPRALLSGLKFYALKAGYLSMELLRFLSIAKAVLMDRAGGLYLLPRLVLSTALAGTMIFALSKHQAYARPGASRR